MDAAAAGPALPVEVIHVLRRRVNYLLMIPAVAAEALQVAQNPDVRMADLAALMERDVKLAADMLNHANSAVFLGNRRVGNLRQAAVKLGLEQIRQLIISSSMFSVMEQMRTGEERVRSALTRHSQLTGSLCTAINREFKAGFQGEEFTAGFLHDFGRILLTTAFPNEFPKADPVDFRESSDLLDRERAAIGATHCDVGAWFAEQNKFPESLSAVVRHHHHPEQGGEHVKLVALVAVADHVANHLAIHPDVRGYDARQNTAIRLLEKSGVAKASKVFAAKLPAIVQAAQD